MIQPILDRILVEVLPNPETTRGGIIIPAMAAEKPLRGIVRKSGPGRLTTYNGVHIPNSLQPGDYIVFSKYAGFLIHEDGKEYKMMNENDVLCKYSPDDDIDAPITPTSDMTD